jgi:hypothetical protein
LAGEPSNPDGGGGDRRWVEDLLDVIGSCDLRPVLLEDRAAERVDLALVRNAETCLLEAKVAPSDAGEEGRRRES